MVDELLESPYLLTVLGLITLIGGLITVYKSYLLLKRNNETKNWENANAIIIESRIEEYENDEFRKMYRILFKYSYKVNNREYNSEGRYLEKETGQSWIGKLKEFVDINKVGNEIMVYYNPDKPEESVIEPRKRTIYILSILAGIAFATIGLVVFSRGMKIINHCC